MACRGKKEEINGEREREKKRSKTKRLTTVQQHIATWC
jgi:hypothetical protein